MYWLLDGKVWPALREVQASDERADGGLTELLAGPTEQEQPSSSSRPRFPADAEHRDVTVDDGVATVELDARADRTSRSPRSSTR